jgi:hypothetical protein
VAVATDDLIFGAKLATAEQRCDDFRLRYWLTENRRSRDVQSQ